ncbi:hypothetical protein J6590_018073 [Homalodisca vitripennis]|nr:hypothetical protein J6590_018073 [Homalodisca vitripennis]
MCAGIKTRKRRCSLFLKLALVIYWMRSLNARRPQREMRLKSEYNGDISSVITLSASRDRFRRRGSGGAEKWNLRVEVINAVVLRPELIFPYVGLFEKGNKGCNFYIDPTSAHFGTEDTFTRRGYHEDMTRIRIALESRERARAMRKNNCAKLGRQMHWPTFLIRLDPINSPISYGDEDVFILFIGVRTTKPPVMDILPHFQNTFSNVQKVT